MPHVRSSFLPALAFTFVVLPTAATAQRAADRTSVPMEAVLTLYTFGHNDALTLGHVPDSLRDILPLDGLGRFVGSRSGGLMGTTIAVAVDGPMTDAVAGFDRRLEEAGWTHPRAPSTAHRGGFQNPTTFDTNRYWCSEDHMVTVSGMDLNGIGYLRISVRSTEQTLCSRHMGRMSVDDRPALPTLRPPEGVQGRGVGMGGGPDGVESSTVLVTEMPLADLMTHFNVQLEAAAWVMAGQADDTDVALRRYLVTDEDGEPWIGTLSLVRMQDDAVRAVLRMDLVGAFR